MIKTELPQVGGLKLQNQIRRNARPTKSGRRRQFMQSSGMRLLATKRDWVLDTIGLLIGRREPAFPYEREIALFEFQTWIYLPYCDFFDERPEVEAKTARVLAAAKFLKQIEKQHLKTPRANPGTSSYLISLLKINEYQTLFDEIIAPQGGWLKLVDAVNPATFDSVINGNIKQVEVATQLVDYRFRYLDHGGEKNNSFANLSHAYVYCYKNNRDKRGMSGRNIRAKWAAYREKAVFLYVSEKCGIKFTPVPLNNTNFVCDIIKQASDTKKIKRFFGTCAYVAKHFPFPGNVSDFQEQPMRIHSFPPSTELRPSKPKTDPLPVGADGIIQGLENYETDYLEFKDN